MKKKILVGVGIIVLLLVVLAVLDAGTRKAKKYSNVVSSRSGMMTENSTGLPSRTLGMPMFKNSVAVQDFSESVAVSNNAVFESVDKKVIKNGDLNLKVNSISEASENIAKIAKDNGGDVFSTNVYSLNKAKSGTVIIKVPVANFEKAFSEIKKIAALVIQESTSGQDVTEEYIDLQSQLKNKQAEEQQFVEIMKQAVKIQDILDVTQQLSRVRGEIEQLQGRLKFLNSQTDMASITVSLSEDSNITIADSWRPWQIIKTQLMF